MLQYRGDNGDENRPVVTLRVNRVREFEGSSQGRADRQPAELYPQDRSSRPSKTAWTFRYKRATDAAPKLNRERRSYSRRDLHYRYSYSKTPRQFVSSSGIREARELRTRKIRGYDSLTLSLRLPLSSFILAPLCVSEVCKYETSGIHSAENPGNTDSILNPQGEVPQRVKRELRRLA